MPSFASILKEPWVATGLLPSLEGPHSARRLRQVVGSTRIKTWCEVPVRSGRVPSGDREHLPVDVQCSTVLRGGLRWRSSQQHHHAVSAHLQRQLNRDRSFDVSSPRLCSKCVDRTFMSCTSEGLNAVSGVRAEMPRSGAASWSRHTTQFARQHQWCQEDAWRTLANCSKSSNAENSENMFVDKDIQRVKLAHATSSPSAAGKRERSLRGMLAVLDASSGARTHWLQQSSRRVSTLVLAGVLLHLSKRS